MTEASPNTGSYSREPFSEEEIKLYLKALLETVDQPRRKSERAAKTFLVDFFGIMNAGKTATTQDVERVFRRNKYKVFCPPETAEINEVRGDAASDPLIFQAKHLIGVEYYVVNLAFDPRFHAVILSRGLIDMLYWYEKGLRDEIYSEQHASSAKERVYEILRLGLVDAFFYFSCSVDAAMEREYGKSITQQRGSKMNEETVSEALEIYENVIAEAARKVPRLPIFRIDTTDRTIPEATHEVFRVLLPALCAQHNVRPSLFIPYSMSLMRREAMSTDVFEQQLKLHGHPDAHTLERGGWGQISQSAYQKDTCLRPREAQDRDGVFKEIIRIREEGGRLTFIYKSEANDSIFSHRRPLQQFEITPEERDGLLEHYDIVTTIEKFRKSYRQERNGTTFTLNCDEIVGLGTFTEIKLLGSSTQTHTGELLSLATELGFTPDAILEGSYLTNLLKATQNDKAVR